MVEPIIQQPKAETQNQKARRLGIPKALKQYNARYGKGGVDSIAACHLQNDAPKLDHWRDRAAKQGRDRPYPAAKPVRQRRVLAEL